jgi:hypothetical protein
LDHGCDTAIAVRHGISSGKWDRNGKRRFFEEKGDAMKNTFELPRNARVGIYWGLIHDRETLELITDMTALAEAELYGDFLTHPRGHYEVWEMWRQSGRRGLAGLHLPKLIAWTEYETLPRGRVVYDVQKKHFTVYADRRLQRSNFSRRIAEAFGLLSCSFSIASDAHYSEQASF